MPPSAGVAGRLAPSAPPPRCGSSTDDVPWGASGVGSRIWSWEDPSSSRQAPFLTGMPPVFPRNIDANPDVKAAELVPNLEFQTVAS